MEQQPQTEREAELLAQINQLQHQLAQSLHTQAQAQVPAPVVHVKVPKPPSYSGKQATTTLQPWLIKVETFLHGSHVNLQTPQAVNVAASYLDGPILEWYTLQRAGLDTPAYQTFQEFKNALTAFLLPVDPSYAARDQLDTLKQTTSAQEYANRFAALVLRVPNMAEADRVHKFVKGLKHEVMRQVMMHDPTTLQAATTLAVRADMAVFKTSRQSRGGPRGGYTSHTQGASSSTTGPTPMELGAHSTQGAKPGAGSFNCYNCGGMGHMAYQCPTPSNGGRGNNTGRGRGQGRAPGRGRGRGRSNNTHHGGAPN